jgi:hypothetical protein
MYRYNDKYVFGTIPKGSSVECQMCARRNQRALIKLNIHPPLRLLSALGGLQIIGAVVSNIHRSHIHKPHKPASIYTSRIS